MTQPNHIPLKIWQTYKDRSALQLAGAYIESWQKLNPEFQYSFLVDEEIDAFMQKHFDSTTTEVFRALPFGVMRADMWRYAVLFIEGGVYADLDAECVIPIRNWPFAKNKLVTGLENKVHFCNWSLASNAGNPVLAQVLDLIVERWHVKPKLGYTHLTHYLTGPGVWTAAVAKYFGAENLSAADLYQTFKDDSCSTVLLDQPAFTETLVKHHYGSLQWQDSKDYVSWTKQSHSLQLLLNRRPIIAAEWSIVTQKDSIVLSNTKSTSLKLNFTAVAILSLCDGVKSLADILEHLSQQFNIPSIELYVSVWGCINEFEQQGVLNLQLAS
jgi:mannosyltransferase OCH1-like enzyme